MSVEIISTEDELSKQNESTEEKKDEESTGDPTGWTLINGMWVMQSSLKQPQFTHNPVKVNRRLKRPFVHKAEPSPRPPKKKTYSELEIYVYKKIQLETEKLIESILSVIERCTRSNLSYIYQVSKMDKAILRLDNNLEMKDIFDYRMVYIKLEKQKQHIEEIIKSTFEKSDLAELEQHYEKMKENNKSPRMAIEVNDESKKYAAIKKSTVPAIMSMKKTLSTLLKFNNKFPICEDTAVFLGIRKNVLQLQQSDRRVVQVVNEASLSELLRFLANDDLGFQYTIFNFETLSILELEQKLSQLKLISAKLEEEKNKLPQDFLLSCDDSIEMEDLVVPSICGDIPWWIKQEFNPDVVKHELDRLRQNAKQLATLDKDMLSDNIVKYFNINLRVDQETFVHNIETISIDKTYMEIFEGMVLLSEDIAKKEFERIKVENSDIENKIKFLHKHKGLIKKSKCQRRDESKKVTAKEIFSKEKLGVAREMLEEELRRLRKVVVFALHKALKKSMPFQPSADEQRYLGMDNFTFCTKADYQHAVRHLDNLRDHIKDHAYNMFFDCTPDQLVDHYTNIRVLNGDVFNENQENDALEMVENLSLQTVAKEIIKLKRGLLVVLSHMPNYSVKRDTTDLLGIWKGLDSRTGCAKKDFYQELLDFLANDDPGTKFVEFQQRYPNPEQLEHKTEEIKIAYAKVYHELLNIPEDVKSSLVHNHRDVLTRPSLKKQGDSRQSTSREQSWENESCSRDRVDKSNLPDLKVEIEASRAAKGFSEFPKSYNQGWQVDRSSVPDSKLEMEPSRTAEPFNQIPNSYSLGWQEYVNVHMIQRGLSEAAIVGLDGNTWAKSNGLQIQKSNIAEILKLFQQFSSASPAPLGFTFSGQVYSFVSRTESVIIGKQRTMGIIFRKTKNAILIGAFSPYGSLEQSTGEMVLSTLADHLLQSGF